MKTLFATTLMLLTHSLMASEPQPSPPSINIFTLQHVKMGTGFLNGEEIPVQIAYTVARSQTGLSSPYFPQTIDYISLYEAEEYDLRVVENYGELLIGYLRLSENGKETLASDVYIYQGEKFKTIIDNNELDKTTKDSCIENNAHALVEVTTHDKKNGKEKFETFCVRWKQQDMYNPLSPRKKNSN